VELTVKQFDTVSGFFSLTIAAMGGAAIYFFMTKSSVSPKYRSAITTSGVLLSIATYHYFRIYASWHEAYALIGDSYKATPTHFENAYRYADWFLTVPLLLIELVMVLALPKAEGRSLLIRLVIAAMIMIGLGYPGEIATDAPTRWFFWAASMIPFTYLLFELFIKLTKTLDSQPEAARGLISSARYVLLVTWAFYPIAFAIVTVTGANNPWGLVILQIGYSVADIASKVGYGLVIHAIARAKSEAEGYNPDAVDSVPKLTAAMA